MVFFQFYKDRKLNWNRTKRKTLKLNPVIKTPYDKKKFMEERKSITFCLSMRTFNEKW